VPDRPDTPDQYASIDPRQANVSSPSCTSIILDRRAPETAMTGGVDSARTGQLVTFRATATDALSGTTGRFTWTWGDGTPSTAGAGVRHTFTRPGTFEVTASTQDGAGNVGTAKCTVKVVRRGKARGGSCGQAAFQALVKSVAASGTVQTARLPELRVVTLKRLMTRTLQSIPVGLAATTRGQATLTLTRRGRTYGRDVVRFRAPDAKLHHLSVVNRPLRGTYSLTVTFRPTGSSHSAARRLSVLAIA
jgi:hypothetical protein